jgi:site-specific recombinase XerD
MPDQTLTELLESYSRYLRTSTRLMPRSQEVYLRELHQMAQELDDPLVSEMSPQDLIDWHARLVDRGLRSETLHSKRTALRSFLTWLDEVREDTQGPRLLRAMKRLQSPRDTPPGREPATIPPDTFAKLMAAAGSRNTRSRDRAMLHFLWDTGLRANELVTLPLDALDMEHRRAKVVGKGDKARTVLFTRSCTQSLQAYLEKRETDYRAQAPNLFVNVDGKPMHPNTVGAILKDVARKARVRQELWPHLFRHTRITELVKSQGLHYAARFAGHSRVETTMHYFHEDIADLQEGYDRAMGEEPEEEEHEETA